MGLLLRVLLPGEEGAVLARLTGWEWRLPAAAILNCSVVRGASAHGLGAEGLGPALLC